MPGSSDHDDFGRRRRRGDSERDRRNHDDRRRERPRYESENPRRESSSSRHHNDKRDQPRSFDDRRSSRQSHHRYEDRDKERISNHTYGYQEAEEDSLMPGLVVQGTVTRIEGYGAFLDFPDPKDEERTHRGLIHVSQLAPHRVEKVTDVLKEHQRDVYAVVLEVEQESRNRRIRLGLKDVDQGTGNYRGPPLAGRNGASGVGGRPPPPRELQRRARQRRDMYLGYAADWQQGSEAWKEQNAPGYLRSLWGSSPEPPSSQSQPAKMDIKKESKPQSLSDSESESESASSSDSSSSDSSSCDRRKRRSRHSRRRDSDRKRRRERERAQNKRSRRQRDSSSSEDSSSSGDSSNSRSSSESDSSTRDKKRIKLDQDEEAPVAKETTMKEAQELKDAVQAGAKGQVSDEDDEGPMPLPQSNAALAAGEQNTASYGKALLPGEGQAIAQYVQQNLRIPRRGEIGYSGDDIDHYEKSGYVMSGSRHARMNAVRIRKENQVYSAEEQRALALITMEENQQKEAQLMEDFRTMLKEKQQARGKAG